MYSELFEGIIRATGEDTDDNYEAEDFFEEIGSSLLHENFEISDYELNRLFEQVLWEMGTFDKSRIATALGQRLKTARDAFDKFAQNIRQKNNYTAIHKRNTETDLSEDNHIDNAINQVINIGNTEEQPFRVKDDNGTIIDNNKQNFNTEIENWTTGMAQLLPKQNNDTDHCFGFSLESIKKRFVAIYKAIIGHR